MLHTEEHESSSPLHLKSKNPSKESNALSVLENAGLGDVTET